jgi:hypothetical protein
VNAPAGVKTECSFGYDLAQAIAFWLNRGCSNNPL